MLIIRKILFSLYLMIVYITVSQTYKIYAVQRIQIKFYVDMIDLLFDWLEQEKNSG